MKKIGITGNIASGKSVFEKFLIENGYSVLDADSIAHELLNEESIKKKILEAFEGFDIVEDSLISRVKLGKVVFTNKTLRRELEKIIHPEVKSKISSFFNYCEAKGKEIAFASVPLLFEANFQDEFDKIVLVYASDDLRKARLIKRNNLTPQMAQERLNIQMNQDEKIKLCDFVLYNNTSFSEFEASIKNLIKLL